MKETSSAGPCAGAVAPATCRAALDHLLRGREAEAPGHGTAIETKGLDPPPIYSHFLLLPRIEGEGLWDAYWRAGIPRMESSPTYGRGETVGSTAYEAGRACPATTVAGDS